MRRYQAKTPLFRLFQKAAASVMSQDSERGESRGSTIATPKISRRDFIAHSVAATSLAISAPWLLTGCSSKKSSPKDSANAPKVVVVGAGFAGLHAANILSRAGVNVTVYEASSRVGGRVFSGQNVIGQGSVVELGAEFIDTTHTELLALVARYQLPLLDTKAPSEKGLHETLYFDGQFYTEADILREFGPIAKRIAKDLDRIGETVNYRNDGGAAELDKLSISQYLTKIGASGWLRKLIEVAYIGEYGLDTDQQSALNLIFLISTDLRTGFRIYGDSDERFKVRGGNQQIAHRLAAEIQDQIKFGHTLQSIRPADSGPTDSGFKLTFDKGQGASKEVKADFVILTLPFSILRTIELAVPLSEVKKRAISELGYGTNTKLFLGFDSALWRNSGADGTFYSDSIGSKLAGQNGLPLQCGWHNTRLQNAAPAGLTIYTGGAAGVAAGQGTPVALAQSTLSALDEIFPGAKASFNGRAERFFWPEHQFSRGSYSAYRPGQWTSISGAEGEPEGNLHFAGEHCSLEFQGFMNGALETGRTAAEAVLGKVGAKKIAA